MVVLRLQWLETVQRLMETLEEIWCGKFAAELNQLSRDGQSGAKNELCRKSSGFVSQLCSEGKQNPGKISAPACLRTLGKERILQGTM